MQDNSTRIGDVLFYFYICFGKTQHPLAMVSLFSLPYQTEEFFRTQVEQYTYANHCQRLRGL